MENELDLESDLYFMENGEAKQGLYCSNLKHETESVLFSSTMMA